MGNLITNGFHLPYNPQLKTYVRSMRKNMSEPERKLWFGYLRHLSVRFLRQRPIDNYIVDFYCARNKLIIEVDGEDHYSELGKAKDNKRTEVLESYGLKVLRFSNDDVIQNFESVCGEIDKVLNYE